MQHPLRYFSLGTIAGLALVIGLTGTPTTGAWADPPPGVGHGKGGGEDHGRGPDRDQGGGRGHGTERDHGDGHHFQDHDRVVVRDYFAGAARQGRCPPGLAKKGNGCLPPGQAKRWRVGAPLPHDVVYYSLPPELVVQLTPPPVGYRYVRVASDILMIAAGTGMVAEAIEDLGR